jgi:hypothetical protein
MLTEAVRNTQPSSKPKLAKVRKIVAGMAPNALADN